MRIVVSHLTRMQRGYMCVAGIDIKTGLHVRPVSTAGRLSTKLLSRYGGPFDMAVVVNLGTPRPLQRKPQTEDYLVDLSKVRTIGTLPDKNFWKLLVRNSETKLRNIFGEDLLQIGGNSYAVEVGKGSVSLGCLIPGRNPHIYIRRRSDRGDQVRMRFSDGDLYLDCGITDMRLYGEDHVSPDERTVQRVAERLQGDMQVILSVGLTRAYASGPDFEPVHWLQINNIHLEDDPTWQLG